MPTRREALLAAAAVPVWAQEVIRVDVNVVNVLCTVRNWRGAFVTDLGKADFQIREDGKPQEIRYFTREAGTPFTVALLIDISGSVEKILDTERAAAGRFFAEMLRWNDKALLASFAHNVAVWQDLTSSVAELRAALNAVDPAHADLTADPRQHGGTLLYEAVKMVSDQRLARQTGRKAMVIISDGLDNGSKVTAEDAAKAAQQADAVVYAIHYVSESKPSAEGERALDALTEPTGGRTFEVNPVVSLTSIFDSIREEIRSQYALGYSSTNAARDGKYRRIAVKTTRSGLRIQARQGYWAPV